MKGVNEGGVVNSVNDVGEVKSNHDGAMSRTLLVEAIGNGGGEVEKCRGSGVAGLEAMLMIGFREVLGNGGEHQGFNILTEGQRREIGR